MEQFSRAYLIYLKLFLYLTLGFQAVKENEICSCVSYEWLEENCLNDCYFSNSSNILSFCNKSMCKVELSIWLAGSELRSRQSKWLEAAAEIKFPNFIIRVSLSETGFYALSLNHHTSFHCNLRTVFYEDFFYI